jgi:hypothetical protein
MIDPIRIIEEILDALPRDDEPSRCHVSDLMVATGLSAEIVEAALWYLSCLGVIIVDKLDADPFHPSEARIFHAGRVFARLTPG